MKADEAKDMPFPIKDFSLWEEVVAAYGGAEGMGTKDFIEWVELMEAEILKAGELSYKIIERTYVKTYPGRALAQFYDTVRIISKVWKRGDELVKCVEDHKKWVKATYG